VLLPATISLSLNNRNAALVGELQQQLQHRRLDKEQRTTLFLEWIFATKPFSPSHKLENSTRPSKLLLLHDYNNNAF
jgi:hypothetical protein